MNYKTPGRRLSVVGFLMGCLLFLGCGYGKVSPLAYEYAKALYSMANRRDTQRIDAVEVQIDAAVASGELAEREAVWLSDIVDDVRREKWDDAQRAARRILEDQLS